MPRWPLSRAAFRPMSAVGGGFVLVAAAACGGRGPAAQTPAPAAREAVAGSTCRIPGSATAAPSARKTVSDFMCAVTDSNLIKIAQLWGSSKGSAAQTKQPVDYERRIVVIQSFLRHDDYRITADVGEAAGRRGMQVELRRQACTWTVPFTVVKAGRDAWVVSKIDLTRAGNPARPCDPNAMRDSTKKE